jgi:hypothetical protein
MYTCVVFTASQVEPVVSFEELSILLAETQIRMNSSQLLFYNCIVSTVSLFKTHF